MNDRHVHNHSRAIAIGDIGAFPLRTYGLDESIPDGTRVIVLSESLHLTPAQVDSLRARFPDCHVIYYAASLNQIAGVDESILGRVDDFVCTPEHLERHLSEIDQRVELLDAYAQRTVENRVFERLVKGISANPNLDDVMRDLFHHIGELFDDVTMSVVLWKPGQQSAYVAMDSTGRIDDVTIAMDDYPEFAEIIRTHEPLVITDVPNNPLLKQVRERLESAKVRHRVAVLFPLIRRHAVIGALFLRSTDPTLNVEEHVLAVGRMLAAVTGIAVGHALEHEILQREKKVLLDDVQTADERLRHLQPFSDFFEQASDGILVTNLDSEIQFANAAAGKILLRDPGELKGECFITMLREQERDTAYRAYGGETVGDAHGYVDLSLAPPEGERVVISAAIRRLTEDRFVLVTFRDVTRLRATEGELRKTKDFLENLIQSSVDGIIAADLTGKIILFNRGAELLTGYSAEEALGHLTAHDIYPPGDAFELMGYLRMEAYGGRGRLTSTPRTVLTKDKEEVPVSMSAAIVYEDGLEIASVGVLTDLRPRMRIENKLEEAQRKLQLSERQAGAMELAGAAAHELNQPLTSIMGYAELMKKRASEDDPNAKAVRIIARETERMAKIVRRIGEITDYETKPYVGGSTILNLGSTEDSER